MNAEVVLAIASVAGTVVVGTGLMVTWRRNGREQRDRDEANGIKQALRDRDLETSYQAITNRLDDKSTGLGALNNKVADMKNHYNEITGRFDERLLSAERDIGKLRDQ